MTTEMTVTATILQQLGGNRFKVMTGAHSFTGDRNALIFKLPVRTTKNGIKCVRITLDPSDTYTMTFFSQKNMNVAIVAEHIDVYEDMLCDLFTSETGLAVAL